VAAPPYDVISDSMRAELLERDPHNVVALELPEGPLDPIAPDNRYFTGAKRWNAWREQGILVQDEVPAAYVLEQRYELDGQPIRRSALILEVALEPFDAGIILRHERVLPKALGDRFELIKSTHANFSQVFGLFGDAAGESDPIFEAARALDPVTTATDDDGVVSLLWEVTDHDTIDAVVDLLAEKPVFIADGHHRYTTALAYRDLQRELADAADQHPVDPDYDYLMMALVNMDDPDLVVLPYHRIARGPEGFSAEQFLAGLEEHFTLAELEPGTERAALAEHGAPAFVVGVRGRDRAWLASLREGTDLDATIAGAHSSAWKQLDVAVLQELILWPLLGIHPDRAETLERLSFTKDATQALASLELNDVAFLLRPTGLDQLREISLGGEIMPQKSTYFFPKLPSGLIFRSMDE
jgi:uncharacterized protein (DUF1015 family)